MAVKELVINRPNWLRSEGNDYSYLYRESDGKMCCLGFYARACGLKIDQIAGKQAFSDLEEAVIPEETQWLIRPDAPDLSSETAQHLMTTNDSDRLGSSIEAFIIRTFAGQGITVTFTDEPLAA